MNRFYASSRLFAAAAIATGLATQASALNYFANGGFETPGVTAPAFGWQAAAAGYTLSSDARTGNFAAQLASPAFNAAVMLQNSVEDGLQPPLIVGDTPTLSFWAKGNAGGTGNVLYALRYLDGTGNILETTGNQFFQASINPSTYTEILNTSLAVIPVGAVAAFLEFSQGIGPIDANLPAGLVLIDDLALNSTIPEPASLALLAAGSLAMLGRRRRSAR